jgi:hypothetical protein
MIMNLKKQRQGPNGAVEPVKKKLDIWVKFRGIHPTTATLFSFYHV